MKQYEEYLKKLPVMPTVATKILSMAEDRVDVNFTELEHLVKVDPSLSTKVLRIANSALYARPQRISTLQSAIGMLGFKNIKSLILLVTASNLFSKYSNTEFYKRFWKHSILTAFLSKQLAIKSGNKKIGEEAFLGGLLHDIGQAAIFHEDPDAYQELIEHHKQTSEKMSELEKGKFNITHKEIGGIVLEKWSFPPIYCDVAREHCHEHISSHHKVLIQLVSAADIISHEEVYGFINKTKKDVLPKFLLQLGLPEEEIQNESDQLLDEIKNDPLYQETKNLFNLD